VVSAVCEQLVRLGLGGAGQPVGGVLGQGQHARRLEGLLFVGRGGLRRRLVHGLRRLRLGLLVRRDGLGGLRGAAGARGGQLLVQLGDPLLKIGVLFDEPGQLVLNQIEEGVDLVLVVAALTNRWLAERDIVDVSWCERHCLPPWSFWTVNRSESVEP